LEHLPKCSYLVQLKTYFPKIFHPGQASHAYILRGPHLLELLTKQYGATESLMVVQKVLFYEAASGKILAEADETLRYVFPDVFRSDSISPYASRLHLLSGGKTLTVIDDKIVANDETLFDLYKDILLYRTRELLGKRLAAAGIDTSLTCLGRFEGKIAVVLGSEKSDERVSQVWVDKETLLCLEEYFGSVMYMIPSPIQCQQKRVRLWMES